MQLWYDARVTATLISTWTFYRCCFKHSSSETGENQNAILWRNETIIIKHSLIIKHTQDCKIFIKGLIVIMHHSLIKC